MISTARPKQHRLSYIGLAVAFMVLGLAVHFQGTVLAPRVRDAGGDLLWAAMIASGMSALMPRLARVTRCSVALVVSYAVEFSQLWDTPVLEHARTTPIGALVLGSGFDARDLVAYAVGVTIFAWIDRRYIRFAISA